MSSDREALLERKLAREKAARRSAESILEAKAIELFQANEKLKGLNSSLEEEVRLRTNELAESESRFRELIESAKDLIYNIDYDGMITYANKVATDHYGYEMKDIVGKHFAEFIHKDHVAEVLQFYVNKRDSGTVESYREFPIMTKAGYLVWIGQNARRVERNGSISFIVIARDITERKKTEDALSLAGKAVERSEAKYRGILENMDLGLLEVDPNDIILRAYPKFCEMSGYDEKELIGQHATHFLLSPEYHEFLAAQNKDRQKGEAAVYEVELVRKDGSKRWVIISGAPFTNQEGEMIGSLGIHFDISDRKRLQLELETAKEAAEEAQKAERLFLASMSHEIRTPLNAIIGMSHLLADTKLTSEQNEYMEILQNSGGILHGLISDILDFAKIDAGRVEIQEHEFDLVEMTQSLVNLYEVKLEERPIELKASLDPKINTKLIGDQQLLNQVLLNLLSNADKFTSEGTISVTIEQIGSDKDSRTVRFAVEDSGVGMTPEELNRIFDEFKQASQGVRMKYGGTGLGLAISRKIVRLMGGEIQVESEKGKGTVFHFTIDLQDTGLATTKHETLAKKKTFDATGCRILVAEDNPFNQKYISRLLEKWEIAFDLADNGKIATEMAQQRKYDIVLMDLSMPEMDGYQATEWIRKHPTENQNIPIIALTASTLSSMKAEALDRGMNDFMTKPFNPSDLEVTLSKYLPLSSSSEVTVETISEEHSNDRGLDQQSLTAMYGDDLEYQVEIFEMFMQLTPPDMDLLEKKIQAKNHEEIYQQAHKLKPTFAMVGLPWIMEQMLAIEKAGREKADFEMIEKNFYAVKQQLDQDWTLLQIHLKSIQN